MRSSRHFWGLWGAVLVAAVLFGFLPGRAQSLRPKLRPELGRPKPQPRTERVYRELAAVREGCIHEGASPGRLYGPLRLHLGRGGNLFIMDYGEMSIKEFTPAGTFVRSYGRGKGQGPGEFMSVTDYTIRSSGELWVADFLGSKIEVFAGTGELRRTIRLERQPFRLVPWSEREFVVMLPLASEKTFGSFDDEGRMLSGFGRFFEDKLSGLALDGMVSSLDQRRFVYVPHYMGWLVAYTYDGKLDYFVEAISPTPLPLIKRDEQGSVWVDRETRLSAQSLSVSNGRIYLLSGTSTGSRWSESVDIYRAADGAYLYSHRLPEPSLMIVFSDSSFFQVKEASVCRWSVKRG